MISRVFTQSTSSLRHSLKRTKIEYDNGGAYNKRWQWKWPHAYLTNEALKTHTRVHTPEEGRGEPRMFSSWWNDWTLRLLPAVRMAFNRRHRCFDKLTTGVLPSLAFSGMILSDISTGFLILELVSLGTIYTRVRDKTIDPDMKEA